MKKEKEYFDAEIVTDDLKSKAEGFAADQMADQMKNIKKALLLKGGFFIAFWLVIFILILALIIKIIFWLLPAIIAFILTVLILGFIFNLSYKLYTFFK